MAKPPTDHLKTAEQRHDADLERNELLADLPDSFREPHRLRIRQQNATMRLALELDEVFKNNPDASGAVDVEIEDYEKWTVAQLRAEAKKRDDLVVEKSPDLTEKQHLVKALTDADVAIEMDSPQKRDQMLAIMEFAERIDEWAESTIAGDADEYADWAAGKKYDTWFALLSHYAGHLGK